jgi:hypothetical protein
VQAVERVERASADGPIVLDLVGAGDRVAGGWAAYSAWRDGRAILPIRYKSEISLLCFPLNH